MNKRTGISNLGTKSSYINILVNGIQTLVIKNANRLSFSISADEETIHKFFTRQEIEFFSRESSVPGGIEIGRYMPRKDTSTSGEWYFLKKDTRIEKHVELTVSLFFKLVDNYQNWPSFREYLKSENQPDAELSHSGNQYPFEYWWLTGKRETSVTIHDVLLYQDSGVFIRPEDNKLPLFTSSFYAEMAAFHYSIKYNTRLTPSFIYCPTCFLTGTGALLGNRILSGGILNEQWNIRFQTCDEMMNTAPCYFCIDDSDGNNYELVGCNDAGTEPLWVQSGIADYDSLSSDRIRRTPWEKVSIN